NVFLAALGKLVGGKLLVLRQRRNGDAFDKLALLAILLAISKKVIFQRDFAPRCAFAQRQPRAERDKGWRRVADGRAIGDIAADRAHIAHLLAGNAVPEFAQLGEPFGNNGQRLGIGDAGKELHLLFALGNVLQLLQMANEDYRPDGAHELGDPQAHIGRTVDDGGTGINCIDFGEVIDARRYDDALGALAKLDPPTIVDGSYLVLERN